MRSFELYRLIVSVYLALKIFLLTRVNNGLLCFACRVTMLPANLDFMIFNHRGKHFLPELVDAKFS